MGSGARASFAGADDRRYIPDPLDGNHCDGPYHGVQLLIEARDYFMHQLMHSLRPIFKWFDASVMGAWVRDSRWIFPAVEAVHIVALALLFGALLVLNLRLLGLTLTYKPV